MTPGFVLTAYAIGRRLLNLSASTAPTSWHEALATAGIEGQWLSASAPISRSRGRCEPTAQPAASAAAASGESCCHASAISS